MNRTIGNFFRSIALFIPTTLCLYLTNLYALNVLRFFSLYSLELDQKILIVRYAATSIISGAFCYFIFLAIWWALLTALWKHHPRWASPKSWLDIFINALISTACLYIAFLSLPQLWINGNVLTTEYSDYTNYTIQYTFGRFAAIWFVAVNAAYALKDSLSRSSARKVEFEDSDFDESYRKIPIQKPRGRQNNFFTKDGQDTSQKEQELLALVRDRKTCERLLASLRKQYPDATRLWIIEKAISDIHRDRRAY